ncbi:hypothetical protein ACLN6N_02615 [Sphingomonas carotinifaciens]|uniref:hypothetical protein n=1 Tax=Sphingomonas carotinifaciens TaxID=1166323 RepID=UPI0039A14B10
MPKARPVVGSEAAAWKVFSLSAALTLAELVLINLLVDIATLLLVAGFRRQLMKETTGAG